MRIRLFRIFVYLALIASSSTPYLAYAFEIGIEPRITTGAMYYEFVQEAQFSFKVPDPEGNPTIVQPSGPSSKVSFSDVMPFVLGGATFFVDRFFIDGYYQGAFSGSDRGTLQRVTNIFTNDFENRDIDATWDRQEFSIATGYALTDNFVVFAGYRRSETDFDERTTIFNIGTQTSQVVDIKVDYDQDGPFVGGAYNFDIRYGKILDGGLSLNLGIAFVSGEVSQSGGGTDFTIKGDTVGLKIGMSWKGRITDNLSYSLGVDGYQYNFDADTVSDPNGIQGADFSETVINGSVGLSYSF